MYYSMEICIIEVFEIYNEDNYDDSYDYTLKCKLNVKFQTVNHEKTRFHQFINREKTEGKAFTTVLSV